MQTAAIGEIGLECGVSLPAVEIAYEAYGTLNERGDNAILICHPLTLDAQADVWWQPLIGPGKVLDTRRYYVICSNVLGGCAGSTGPQAHRPFPLITIRDMVRAQKQLLDRLGVKLLQLVLGGSMGGLQTIEWAVTYPSFVKRCAPMATSGQLSALAIGYNHVMRSAIENDPVHGLALARKIGMITYRSFELFEARFGREIKQEDASLQDTWFQIESYLEHMGDKLNGRFDVNSYLCLLKAMDLHDIGRGRGGAVAALERIEAEVLWVGIDTDHLYPPQEQRMWAERLRQSGKQVTYCELSSPYGHDAFLVEGQQLSKFITDFLRETGGN
ncbi:homoserine O-acetyltransferase [Tumebacillus algifaecis]|uniref:Homoserine O-acetyltransferase n=1 Tax=Tumebacillus algifaecis TaxID=1214604 RepID=A0A223D013_9BACL|nr:homoserine O-acetyltransferase [Tumebacillus algifaecis]ASS74881.1 homoserine O-acetyltransferase [Tumebacillus algifaecis]